jgi:2'-5' RNA ligase
MRLFICSRLSDENQTVLAAAVRNLVSHTHHALRAIPPGTAHLTFVRSTLTPEGPEYSEMAAVPIGA